MFRHLVFFKWSNEANATKINAVKQALMTLPGQIPNIAYFNVYNCIDNQLFNQSTNQSTNDFPIIQSGYTTVIDSVFETQSALLAYGPHAAHQHVVSTFIKPILADITVVDYEINQSISLDAFLTAQKAPHFRHITLLKPKAGVSINQLTDGLKFIHSTPKTNPRVTAAWAGSQSISQWPESYGDRSKGYHLCIETTLDQKSSWQEYVDHPAHADAMTEIKKIADVSEPFTFDYEL